VLPVRRRRPPLARLRPAAQAQDVPPLPGGGPPFARVPPGSPGRLRRCRRRRLLQGAYPFVPFSSCVRLLTRHSSCPASSQCGKPGHIARSCPEAGGAYGGAGAGGFTSGFGGPAKTCYNCGGQGHIAAACTSPQTGGGFSRGAGGGACYSCGQVRTRSLPPVVSPRCVADLFLSSFPARPHCRCLPVALGCRRLWPARPARRRCLLRLRRGRPHGPRLPRRPCPEVVLLVRPARPHLGRLPDRHGCLKRSLSSSTSMLPLLTSLSPPTPISRFSRGRLLSRSRSSSPFHSSLLL